MGPNAIIAISAIIFLLGFMMVSAILDKILGKKMNPYGHVTEFEEGMYYVSTGRGENWSDYDGPFPNPTEAVNHMAELCGEYATPEMVNSAVLTHFRDGQLDLAKDDNRQPINGQAIHWGSTIWKDGEIIWEPRR